MSIFIQICGLGAIFLFLEKRIRCIETTMKVVFERSYLLKALLTAVTAVLSFLCEEASPSVSSSRVTLPPSQPVATRIPFS